MMRSVFSKTLYDRRWFIVGWSIAFAALAALMVSFFPAMTVSGLSDLVNNMPPAFKGLVGDLALLESFDTYIASQFFDIRLPLIGGIMAIILGLGLSSNEEESGELRTIAALPISRSAIVLQKWLVIAVISALVTLAMAIGIVITVPLVDGATLSPDAALPLLFVSWLLIITFGTIPFAAGVAFGRRSIAMAAGVLVVIGSFILTTFGQAVDWIQGLERLSLLYYFPATEVVREGINWPDAIILTTITLISLSTATVVFRNRDIA